MSEKLQNRRVIVLLLLLLAGFAGLAYRLVDLQVLRHGELRKLAIQNIRREFLLEPLRGDILDCRGNVLATSVFVKTVCADPVLVDGQQAAVARAIAPILQLPETELADRLRIRLRQTDDGRTITNRYVVLKRKVPEETWERVRQTMRSLRVGVNEDTLTRTQREFLNNLRQHAVFADRVDDQLRVYPNQHLASHVLGFVGLGETDINGGRILQVVGRSGIERTLDNKLKGVPGWRLTETVHGHELATARDQDVPAIDGLNAVLTLDSVLQHILEEELAVGFQKHTPVSICGVIMRPRTGEILAMATLPDFDPNHPGKFPAADRRNRVLTDIMEPGSTFKTVVISSALNDRLVTLQDRFDCEQGAFAYGGRVLHDHGKGYGVLSVKEIITKSSNIGAAKIGIRMGAQRLQEHILQFGFGARTGTPLPGEVSGIVHDPEDWSAVTIAQLPMGQGIAVTRMQMMMAVCAIANGGWLMRPMLVERLESRNGTVVANYSPQRVRQVVSAQAARETIEALKTVPTQDGTAPEAALDHYTVAGKTGTAQKAVGGVYPPGKYFASFIGFLPADNPELCIGVFYDEPHDGHYGGVVAGPVFKRIAERAAAYLGLPPEPEKDAGQSSGIALEPMRNRLRVYADGTPR